MRRFMTLILLAVVVGGVLAQLPPARPDTQSGTIRVMGADALAPLVENIATLYTLEGFRGTINTERAPVDAAFQQFCAGSVDIVMADRLITPTETTACSVSGLVPLAFTVATDALIVATSPTNSFLTDLTSAELQLALSSAFNWSDVRPTFPNQPINRYLPAQDSGAFVFLAASLFGGDASRMLTATNVVSSADSNVLLQGLQFDVNGIGVLSASVFNRNSSLVRAVPLNNLPPTTPNVMEGLYPLSRPLVLYSSAQVFAQKAQVQDFVNYALSNVSGEVTPLGLYQTTAANLAQAASTWFTAATGQAAPTPMPTPLVPLPTEEDEVVEDATAPEPLTPLATFSAQVLALLIDARADLEVLAAETVGIVRPAGWNGSLDTNNPQLPILIRLDLELLAGTKLGAETRPEGWFGAVPSTSLAIARDIRHDLEVLADELLGKGVRPSNWAGVNDRLILCDRATQALVNMMTRNNFVVLQTSPSDPQYCKKAAQELATFIEVYLLTRPPEESLFTAVTKASLPGAITIRTTFAVAFLDRGARVRLGVIPIDTPVTPIARSYVRFSNMMLVQGEEFLVYVDYNDTNLDRELFLSLPNADDITTPTFCTARWCSER